MKIIKVRLREVIFYTILLSLSLNAYATPKEDLMKFRKYFKQKFPDIKFQDFGNGVYALDKSRREIWEGMEDFAPAYTDAVELGKKLFYIDFPNGKNYSSCFKNGGIGIKHLYPYFSKATGKVKTLEKEINQCRIKNNLKPLKYKKGHLAAISAFMASTSRGKPINVKVPSDKRALKVYNTGKHHFYAKRGQLNFSCADCHMYNAGMNVRADLLSPALGQVSNYPVWRLKWAVGKNNPTAGLGTLHRRYAGCNKNIRSKPFKAQSDQYVGLEYFHSYMNNGIKLNGPAIRQ